jgi:hypothetical protein
MDLVTYIHPSKRPFLAKVIFNDGSEKNYDHVIGMYNTKSNGSGIKLVGIENKEIASLNDAEYKNILFVSPKKEIA